MLLLDLVSVIVVVLFVFHIPFVIGQPRHTRSVPIVLLSQVVIDRRHVLCNITFIVVAG